MTRRFYRFGFKSDLALINGESEVTVQTMSGHPTRVTLWQGVYPGSC